MDVINLGIGDPETALLPLEELREAAQHRLSLGERAFLNYLVPEQDSPAFRDTLAGFLTRHYRCPVDARDLLMTAGASHGLELPEGVDNSALLQHAHDAGILLQPGTRFSMAGHFGHCLRLCFACHSEARIREGCERLGLLVRQHLRSKPRGG